MKKLIKVLKMDLYYLDREHFTSNLAKTQKNIEFVSITEKNLNANKDYKIEKHNKWKNNLKKGAIGLFAVIDGKIIAHGWLKKAGVFDTFYRFGKNIAYLSEFFCVNEWRGNGIYPALLSKLIISENEYNDFFISVYQSNTASRNGLIKVGFQYVKSFRFLRVFKITLNKHRIVLYDGVKQ